MRKHYVLDTNVLLQDPQAIFKFEDNYVYIPIFVLEEIDKFKNETSERGRNARHISKLLDQQRAHGSLNKGVDLPNGGKLFVYVPSERGKLCVALQPNSADSDIIHCALEIQQHNKEELTSLITRDVNLRIRSDILGLNAQNYENQSIKSEDSDIGYVDINVEQGDIDCIYKTGQLLYGPEDGLYDNACAVLHYDRQSALARYSVKDEAFKLINVPKEGILNIKPKNKEQAFAFDALMDDNIKLVNLIGRAGSGKTLISTCVGLCKVLKEGKYNKLVVARPIMPMGKDIGYLPGDISEKLSPWMKPIMDNLEFLMMNKEIKNFLPKNSKGMVNLDKVFEDGIIQIEPLTYIRGRSLPNQYIIIDECQNLNIHEIKTIISRCGEGTKIVLTGDPEQIDNPYVDSKSNGLSIVSEKLKGESITSSLKLNKCERSALADLAIEKL